MPEHYIPDIRLSIVPATTVPYIAVRAEWKGRSYQVVLHSDEFKHKIGTVIRQLIEEVLIIEEALHGKEEH